MENFFLGDNITIEELSFIVENKIKIELSKKTEDKLNKVRNSLEKLLKTGKVIYGINTGFGHLASQSISQENLNLLQLNLIRSHSCGVGKPLSDKEARGLLFVRMNELARGKSGVRPILVKTMLEIFNKGIVPYIPEKGSVGASGDLAPSAHMALVLLGEGKAKFIGENKFQDSKIILNKVKIKPIILKEKEGLALINGTQSMQAVGGLSLFDSFKLFYTSLNISALTIEALKGTPVAFDERIHKAKPHPGQIYVANKLSELLKNSEIRKSHLLKDKRVQDPYSLRCIPQVMGPVLDNLKHCLNTLEIELSSVTDNPLVFLENDKIETLSGGNFHGQALSFIYDFSSINLTALANISERRISQLVSDFKILPPFLTKNPGLESGFMIPQVTAAALCNENKSLSHPSSTDSIPTSANQEDFVSMGMNAALKLREVVKNTSKVLAIEMMAGIKGIEFHRPLKTSKKLEEIISNFYRIIPKVEGDKEFSFRIEKTAEAILEGKFL